ncbi:MAG TPA: c-type cytochrome biogenesis protein CcsB, partial [Telluria sp.]
MELSHTSPPKTTSQPQVYTQAPGYFKRLSAFDWLFGAGLLAAALFALSRFSPYMDVYEQAILLLAVPTFATLGWHFKPVRWLMPLVALLALWAASMYGGSLEAANQKFFLKYMLSSQSAILWMSTLFV